MNTHHHKTTYLITDGGITAENFKTRVPELLKTLERAIDIGVSMIQIREKQLPARLVFELTVRIARITAGSATKLLVNDRADIALAAGADGVHLTSASIPPAIIRNVFGSTFLIGVSTHSVAEVVEAAGSGADFAVFGPVFATPGKGPAVGIDALRDAHAACAPMPLLGLGGIDGSNFDQVFGAADGFAAIRFFSDPQNLARVQEWFGHHSATK